MRPRLLFTIQMRITFSSCAVQVVLAYSVSTFSLQKRQVYVASLFSDPVHRILSVLCMEA
jgi:hypothetical protein